ncbi:GNAT family N-acetyltransferase [Ascidiimonas sp. W6]|uniref:GNAT family N-acetyltransferase n=1 Tax=Ascidiimonas meishanensis TaxID=3128903 RepID=UPI0030EE08EE
MEIRNSVLNDLPKIFELYHIATNFMQSKNQVAWPEFSRDLIIEEIEDLRQWKLLINGKIACIWATTLKDELIWGKENTDPSVYIHRIATDPYFRGQKLVKQIVRWADNYCINHHLDYIRMDTVGLNQGLIKHYEKLGFTFLGTKELDNVTNLPKHYSEGPVCLFQRKVKNKGKHSV